MTSEQLSLKRKEYEMEELEESDAIHKKLRTISMMSPGFRLNEIKGDLFTCSTNISLAHCISADLKMGKGIALLFKNRFGGINELKEKTYTTGSVGVLHRGNRFIYYLVTKESFSLKPTYLAVRLALSAMKEHAIANNVKDVAMPKIGCADSLKWPEVKAIIAEVFAETDIVVSVFSS